MSSDENGNESTSLVATPLVQEEDSLSVSVSSDGSFIQKEMFHEISIFIKHSKKAFACLFCFVLFSVILLIILVRRPEAVFASSSLSAGADEKIVSRLEKIEGSLDSIQSFVKSFNPQAAAAALNTLKKSRN